MRQHVEVTSRRNRFEEIAGLDRHAVFHAARFQDGWRVSNNMRPVEQHTSRSGMSGQDRRQQIARSTTDIDNGLERRESRTPVLLPLARRRGNRSSPR
jgi:hypothetical protein